MPWTKDEAKALADRILGMSSAPECEVALELSRTAHTRFAASDPTTAGAANDLAITITSRGAGRSGTVRVNDTETEALIQDAFEKLMTSRTAIVIAHRLSTIRKADQIVVLKEGRIMELGNHQTLVNKPDGYYAALVRAQASGAH